MFLSLILSLLFQCKALHCIDFNQFLGHVPGSSWWGVNLSLCAINMAEAAGDALPLTQLAEIYATCAIRIQISLPWKLKYLSVSYCCYQI